MEQGKREEKRNTKKNKESPKIVNSPYIVVPKAETKEIEPKCTPAQAISQFECRINGLFNKSGERVEVDNLRIDGNKYVADITRYQARNSKARWREGNSPVDLHRSSYRDVLYWKGYIDTLVLHPQFNYYGGIGANE